MKKAKKKRLQHLADRRRQRAAKRSLGEVVGKLKMTHSGFGFVTVEGMDEDVFIPARMINSAIDGDVVRVELLPPRQGYLDAQEAGPAGRIIEIVERTRTSFVGEILPGNRIRALDPHLPPEIFLRGSRHGAERGQWVKFRLDDDSGGVWHGSVIHAIGKSGVVSNDLDAIMEEFQLQARYSDEENSAAAAIVARDIQRVDRRALVALTIDPVDAKDFDDAVSIFPGEAPDQVTIGVHISDVAAYIAPKSRFDQAAARRGFSTYLPGRTLPMLPSQLTAKISLHENADCLAHTVFLRVDRRTGEVVGSTREHSLIRVAKRLDYGEVQQFHESGKAPKSWSKEVAESIKLLLDITAKMRRFRFEHENFIELPLPEVRVMCDEGADKVNGLEVRNPAESEQLVEECMLAANSAVGAELVRRNIPGIFRVHLDPEPEKTMEFCDLMQESFGISCGNIANRKVCNKLIADLPDDARKNVILNFLLRSLARASYSAESKPHFALGKNNYAHFTSPIRRYPDLTVHQQLWNFDSKVRLRSAKTLEKVAAATSEQEENNDNAYYAASDRLKLRYLEEKLNSGAENLYEGVIAKITTGGLQVDVGEIGLYGFVPVETLGGQLPRGKDRSSRNRAYGSRPYRVGDFIYLRLAQIDFIRGEAIFAPAGR